MIDVVDKDGGRLMYTTWVSDACLAIHGCVWLPPDDPAVIAQLVLDASATPAVHTGSAVVGTSGAVRLDHAPVIRTGISMGPVAVEVTTHDSAPSPVLDGADDVAELSVLVTQRPATISGYEDVAPSNQRFDRWGLGWYRLRVHATGRDVAPDLVVEEPVETYRIDVWRADHAEPVALTASVTEPEEVRARRRADAARAIARMDEQLAVFRTRRSQVPELRLTSSSSNRRTAMAVSTPPGWST